VAKVEILLKDIIVEDKYAHLGENNLIINSVRVNKANMELSIDIKAPHILLSENIEEVKEMLSKKFDNFKINLSISYEDDINSQLGLDCIIDNIKSIISMKIPSSGTWVREIKWEENEEGVILTLPNQMAYFSVERSGVNENIYDLINTRYGKKLFINYIENNSVDYDSFLEEKEIEERKISNKAIVNSPSPKETKITRKETNNRFTFGKSIKDDPIAVSEISINTGLATVKGSIFQVESRSIKGNKTIISFYISDGTDSIPVKLFLSDDKKEDFLNNVIEDSYVLIEGDVIFDTYIKSTVIMLKSLIILEKQIRKDISEEKRVELHLHTQMSAMDGVTNAKKLVERAKEWGHKAIAITDHGIVQAFPDAMEAGKKHGVKIIYGVEGYMINDKKDIITNFNEDRIADNFVVFDLETTGLSAKNDMITEIGAIRIVNGKVTESFSQLINPEIPIPYKITEITGITNEMVAGMPTIKDVIHKFKDFIKDSILVAHNATFDIGFIREKMKIFNLSVENPVLDTLELSRAMFPGLKSHKLNVVAKHLDVRLVNHHRAVDDATATGDILLKSLDILKDKNINTLKQINSLNSNLDISKGEVYHVIILTKNYTGLKNLYKLISDSHIKYFHRKPRLPKSLIDANREGLLIGSACEAGELYKAILKNKSHSEIKDIISFYDYLEIQPIGNNMYLAREGLVKDEYELQSINRRIYELGKKYNKITVATGDVHFMEPEDEIYRRILMSGQGFSDADNQAPLYFKTTDEMLKEFSYLGEDIAKEVVVHNPNYISDSIEQIIPIPDGTYPPIIEGADEELRSITYEKAHEIYGDPLPEIVKKRLDRELNSIISNGYAVMYIIAQKLVWKSVADGYMVGSRGSVGSSFAATMSGITEVNPLVPHYVCPNCKYSEFFEDGIIASGADLDDKDCPVCNHTLTKDGQDIPFEVFLGFEGDKEPDIDLNFAGEYQANAHKYTEELFGEGYVFRAGTIGTIAEKTAYGFVKKYYEERGISINPAEINRLVKGCTGIKRTSGQHPGGVMIVPSYKDILDFTPIQYPADDKNSGVITTHFDYHSISGRILKLDILGHDTPTIIKMLEDITNTNSFEIPLDDKDTLKLFTSTEPLKIKPEDINCPVGTMGIPEFGTKFVRQMLIETKPYKFSDLVRISGLSHGTNVWVNNAQELVKNDVAPLSKVISTREDIMLGLINAGMDKKQSFFIMEKVRKGKGLSPEDEASMREHNLPEWYIESCQKIKYMFPKAHAAAYVMISFRIAYYKVHYPEAFYATYFTIKAADFDAELILQGKEAIKNKLIELDNLGNNMTAKEKNLYTVLEVALEMYSRGLKFERVDLYRSDSDKFLISEKGILPPLKGLEGVGENAARKIVEERNIKSFISIEDLINRGKANKPVIEALTKHGCLDELPESNQISLFSI
jgi:DNA polymerase-3 subunit alpha (Gram-positive type)